MRQKSQTFPLAFLTENFILKKIDFYKKLFFLVVSLFAGELVITPFLYADTTPPCAISNLTALAGTYEGEIKLTWTAPGDDGTTGTASTYDIRYSTVEAESPAISTTTHAAAPSVSIFSPIPAPQKGGSAESMLITGLEPGTTYYFAIRTADEVPLWSDLSNGGTTWAQIDEIRPSRIENLSALTDTTVPGTDGEVNLSWTAPGDDGTVNPLGSGSQYKIQYATWNIVWDYSNAQFSPDASGDFYGTPKSYPVILNQETTWYFRIWTKDNENNYSDISNGATAWAYIAPAWKVNLEAWPWNKEGEIKLNWTTPGDDGTIGQAIAYNIRYTLEEGPAPYKGNMEFEGAASVSVFSPIPSPGPPGSPQSMKITGLVPGTTYYFAIKTRDEIPLWSRYPSSNEAKTWAKIIPPDAITDLTATQESDREIKLTWTAPGDDGTIGTATTYDIRYAISAEESPAASVDKFNAAPSVSEFLPIPAPEEAGTVQSMMLTGLTTGTTYYFAIRTRDETSFNWSGLSNGATNWARVIPPAAITDLQSTHEGLGEGEVKLTWTAPGDDGTIGTAATYDIRWALSSISDTTTFETAYLVGELSPIPDPQESGSLESMTITGLTAGATYWFAMRTEDENSGNWSGLSNETSTWALKIPPGAITDLSATQGEHEDTIKLRWTAPGDDGTSGQITDGRWQIKYTTSPSAIWDTAEYEKIISTTALVSCTLCSYVVTGLVKGTTYYFWIKTRDEIEENWSDLSNKTTNWAQWDYTSPGKITTLIAEPGELRGEIDLSWSAPGDNEYSGQITDGKWRIQYASWTVAWSTGAAQKIIPIADVNPGDSQSCTITGLIPGQDYYFRIWTADEVSNWSEVSDGATTWAQSAISISWALVAWADYTNDGLLDLVVNGNPDGTGGETMLYTNESDTATAKFKLDQGTPIGEAAVYNGSLAWGDYDNDGWLDLIITGNDGAGQRVTKLFKNHSGVLEIDEGAGEFLSGVDYSCVDWGDYDNDGDLDLVLCGWTGATNITKVYQNNNGVFEEDTRNSLPGVCKGAVGWVDWDNDGDLDLFLSGNKTPPLESPSNCIAYFYENNPDKKVQKAGVLVYKGALPAGFDSSSQAFGDFDNDGDSDLLICGEKNSQPWTDIYENVGNWNPQSLQSAGRMSNVPMVKEGDVAWGDYNGDGWRDFVVCGATTDTYVTQIVYYNSSTKEFGEERVVVSTTGVRYGGIDFADVELDGDLDLVFGGVYKDGTSKTLFRLNTEAPANTSPLPPAGFLSPEYKDCLFTITWLPGGDVKTGEKGLNYNVRIGTFSGACNIISGAQGSPFRGNWGKARIGDENGIKIYVAENTTYYYSVQAIDAGLLAGSWSAEQHFRIPPVAPGAITDLAGEPGDEEGSIKLSWTAPGDDGQVGRAESYDIRYATLSLSDSGGETTAWWNTASASAISKEVTGWQGTSESATITSLSPGATYYFAIETRDEVETNWSEISNSSGTPAEFPATFARRISPGKIGDLTALIGLADGEVILEWTAPGDDGTVGSCSGYLVRYSTQPISPENFDSVNPYPQNWTPESSGLKEQRTLTGFQIDTLWYFCIKAFDEVPNYSEISNLASFFLTAVPPAQITDLQGEACMEEGVVKLFWTAPGDDGTVGRATAYDIRFAEEENFSWDGGEIWKSRREVAGSAGFSETEIITGLLKSTTYYFKIKTVDDTEKWSDSSNEAFVLTKEDWERPSKITDLVAVTGDHEGQIILEWTAPGDNGTVGVATRYILKYSSLSVIDTDEKFDSADTYTQNWLPQPAGSLETYTVENLGQGTTYYFNIKAEDDASLLSEFFPNPACAWAQKDVDAPAEVSLSAAPGKNEGDIKLTWRAPGDDGNSGTADHYFIKYATGEINTESDWDNAIIWKANRPVGGTAGFRETEIISGLICRVTFYFALKTVDEVGNWSEISNSPLAQARGIPPAAVTDLVAATAAHWYGGVMLSWTAPGDDGTIGTAASYILKYSTTGLINAATTWATASEYSQSWAPLPPGIREEKVVTGLVPGATYYFALKTQDEVPLASEISNCVSAVAMNDVTPPVISLQPLTKFNLAEEELVVDVLLTDEVRVGNVNGKYRRKGGADEYDLKFDELARGTTYYHVKAVVPEEFRKPPGIEYYVIVTDDAGHSVRSPSSGWYSIDIRREGPPTEKFATSICPAVFGTDTEEVKIWDVTGTLAWEESNPAPGSEVLIWNIEDGNGNQVESGVYIYQLKDINDEITYGTIVVAK